ncbi:hypothetical protein SLE2022_037590 [Rubroshorea leprosula]
MYASARQMGHGCLVLVGIAGMIFVLGFGQVAAQGEVGEPASSSLCISECETCPVICSPSPEPLVTIYPPPSPLLTLYPPPPPLLTPYPPPPLLKTYPPPPVHHSTPHSPPPPPPAPSSYPYGGTPPPPKYSGIPYPYYQGPPYVGPHQYPYPYYYFYSSEASSVSFSGFILACIAALLHYFAVQW